MSKLPPDYHIQHEQPPIFYCWKYWLTTGELHEGCTSLKGGSNQDFLDLNEYGWVYITVPLLALCLLLFVFYFFCRGGSSAPKKKPLLSEESDSEIEFDDRRPPRKSYAVPVRTSDAKNFYTVVPIDPASRKVPLHGGVEPQYNYKQMQHQQLQQHNQQQQRIYPRLTAIKKQAGVNGKPQGNNAQPKQKGMPAYQQEVNEYHPDPTTVVTTRGASAPPKHEDHEVTSSEESESEEEQ